MAAPNTAVESDRERHWQEFYERPLEEKMPLFFRDGALFDCLFSQQFTRESLDRLCALADHMREITKEKSGDDFLQSLLSNKRAMLYFSQPSTRTFMSFSSACHVLVLRVLEIRDLKTSSVVKGESLDDTIRTFSSYVDLIIMRHHEAGFAERASWGLNGTKRPVPVINAGSGAEQHPTQALLDIYTLNRYLQGGLDGKKIVMVGDLKRGRTVRSLSYLMKNYKGIHLTFVAPDAFRMQPDILDFLGRHGIPYRESEDLLGAVEKADAVYMTRIQDEYDQSAGDSKKVDYSPFHFTKKHLDCLPEKGIILHPLPRREEIPTEIDDDPRAVYWRQERNGMWIRAALIATIFGLETKILEKK